jgi:hypothetical protein
VNISDVMALSCTSAGIERGSEAAKRRWIAKLKVDEAAAWPLTSVRN